MLKRTPLLDAFEARLRAEPPDIALARRIVEALFAQACAHGVFPLKDPLDGIEVDIRLARALHVRPAAR